MSGNPNPVEVREAIDLQHDGGKMSYKESVGMFELSRIQPRVHVIDSIAEDVIRAARLGAELLDGDAIRLPPSSEVWSTELWSALLDKYLHEDWREGDQKFAVFLLNPDIIDAAMITGANPTEEGT